MTAGFRLAAASKLPDPANRANVTAKYLQLPLTFEMNEGQSDPQVKALARGSGYGLFLTSTESVFVVAPGKDQAVVRVRAVGANPDAKVTGMDRLSSTSNYFVGNDKSKWRKNVAQYARVKYDSIYPGVDLVYYGNQRQLEYDYVVAPGADPNSIQFAVDGARKLHIERNGDLRLDTRQGALYQHKPVIYQQIDGARREIAGNFILRGDRVSFRVGEYDRGKELVIDPSLVFLTYLGGSGTDSGKSIAITSDTGVTLVAGSTSSANFPIVSVAGVTSYPYTNETDGFLAVLNPAGTKLFNSTYVGGSGGVNTVTSVAVDNFEVPRFLYVAGYTTSTSFDVVNPAQATYGGGGADGWVAQLVLDLTVISFMPVDYTLTTTVGFCTYLGGSGTDEITGIAIEQLTKDVFVTGYTTSTNFPVTSGVVQKTNAGGQDAFVARYASGCSDTDNGLDGCTVETTAPGKLIFSTYLGGTGTDTANGIAIYDNPTTGSTNAYIVGTTTSTALPAVAHAGVESNVTPAVSDSSAFLVSMSGHGTTTYFSNIIGSSTTTTQGNAVTTDAAGNIYITGNTNDSTLTTVAPIFKHYQGDTDGFVGAYGSGGTAHFFTYFGGAGYDVPYGIGVFSVTSGTTTTTNLFIAGQTNGSYYITTGAPQSVYGGGTSDGFVSMMTNTSGSTKWTIGYSTYMGGPGADVIYGLSVGTSGNARVTGLTNSTTGMATTGAFQTTIGGGYDAFVAEIQTTP
jgi:hypothetical protein